MSSLPKLARRERHLLPGEAQTLQLAASGLRERARHLAPRGGRGVWYELAGRRAMERVDGGGEPVYRLNDHLSRTVIHGAAQEAMAWARSDAFASEALTCVRRALSPDSLPLGKLYEVGIATSGLLPPAERGRHFYPTVRLSNRVWRTFAAAVAPHFGTEPEAMQPYMGDTVWMQCGRSQVTTGVYSRLGRAAATSPLYTLFVRTDRWTHVDVTLVPPPADGHLGLQRAAHYLQAVEVLGWDPDLLDATII